MKSQDYRLDGVPVSPPATLPATLSTKQAARFLGISNRTLEDWRRKRQGPLYCHWGRLVRYRVSDLENFVADASWSGNN
jgi:excisionase family DNA binding protein